MQFLSKFGLDDSASWIRDFSSLEWRIINMDNGTKVVAFHDPVFGTLLSLSRQLKDGYKKFEWENFIFVEVYEPELNRNIFVILAKELEV